MPCTHNQQTYDNAVKAASDNQAECDKYTDFATACTTAKAALDGYANSLELIGLYCTNVVLTGGPIDNSECHAYAAQVRQFTTDLENMATEATAAAKKYEDEVEVQNGIAESHSGICWSCWYSMYCTPTNEEDS